MAKAPAEKSPKAGATDTPKQLVEKQFSKKDQLVDELVAKLGMKGRDGESVDELKARLKKVSNSKLLSLHTAQSRLKADFGDKTKLVDKLLELTFAGRGKLDQDYRRRLERWSVKRLVHALDHLSRKAK